jgi:hypothetical protein
MEASSSKATVVEATVEATDLSTTGQPLALVYAFSRFFVLVLGKPHGSRSRAPSVKFCASHSVSICPSYVRVYCFGS